ncbi:PAS domain S-box protein [Mangrovibrevibacter kandeliae]|uniref:PAS domain S-box protein n=1 Tax=Mangrovibrevibacter kandeliae TaxID=2968473 RepID=UPI00211819BF|nr:PAS domain S-box protein [Aurantimonas sp. CSK15Z-1]MCQ8780782.1 PAS domain S-box protein [Aurantimonas sp. CSK15Z-1]
MAIFNGASGLAVMTRSDVRRRNGDGMPLVLLTPAMDEVVWANTSGARLLGRRLPIARQPLGASTVERQIASARRQVASTGRARLLLRTASGGLKPLLADLERTDDDAYVILAVGKPVAEPRPADAVGRFLDEAGMTGEAAALFDRAGHLLAGTAAFPATELPHLEHVIADFDRDGGDLAELVVERHAVTCARLGEDVVLLRLDALLEPTPEPAPAPAASDAPPTYARPLVGTFSVKRQKLPQAPSGGIGALVERWRHRQASDRSVDPAPEDSGTTAASGEFSANRETSPASQAEAEAGAEAAAAPSASAEATRETPEPAPPLRSRWDAAPLPHPVSQEPSAHRAAPHPSDAVLAGPRRDDAIEASGAPVADTTASADPGTGEEAVEAPAASAAPDHSLRDVVEGTPRLAGAELEPAPDPASSEREPMDPAAAQAPFDTLSDTPFEADFARQPVRFVWQIDEAGRFRSLSPEFEAAVGPRASDIIGRRFSDVAQVFGFDTDGEIARLLERRDTWSGRSILWPVQGSGRRAPVDLAGLPVFARDRSFDGFRGFGVVRLGDAVDDPDRIGHVLAADAPYQQPFEEPPEEAWAAIEGPAAAHQRPDGLVLHSFPAEPAPPPFGRRTEPPATADEAAPANDRRPMREAALTLAEAAAFREIGEALTGSNAAAPGAEDTAVGMAADEGSAPPVATFADETPPAGADQTYGDAALPAPADQPFAGWREPPAPAGPETGTVAVAAGGRDPDAIPTGDVSVDASPSTGTPDPLALQNTPRPGATDDEAPEPAPAAPAVPEEFAAIFAALPLAVLLAAGERILYANRAFAELSGFADADALEAAGGLDRLFVERGETPAEDGEAPSGDVEIRRADDGLTRVRAQMQRVTIAGRSCLLMSIRAPATPALAMKTVEPQEPVASPELDRARRRVEELQAVLDTATDGVLLLDHDGNVRSANGSAQALFGVTEAEVEGRHVSTLFSYESRRATLDYLDQLRDGGMARVLNDGREVVGRVAKGGDIPLFITIGGLPGGCGWCMVLRDIAHWKKVEEDLTRARRQAEEASVHKTRFLANISHELRTPMNAIIGFADVMASEYFGPLGSERYLEYLADIKKSGHHVLDLVNDLLDISKIEAGKADLNFEPVSLNETIAEVVGLMQPQANRDRVIVRSNLPASVPQVMADRRSIRQIALNLLSNAIRFTPSGGQIIASTARSEAGEVVLRFRDSGIGMSEREIEMALTPFQQVPNAGRGRGDGTGLGLPLTKAMVEANRARFAIQSQPGEGTLVEIVFPAQRVLAG